MTLIITTKADYTSILVTNIHVVKTFDLIFQLFKPVWRFTKYATNIAFKMFELPIQQVYKNVFHRILNNYKYNMQG